MRWERVQLQPKQAHQQQQQQQQELLCEISGPGKRWGHTCNAIKEGRSNRYDSTFKFDEHNNEILEETKKIN
ncbi:hypothetical protein ACE6H2_018332 [Prunus campanulata]